SDAFEDAAHSYARFHCRQQFDSLVRLSLPRAKPRVHCHVSFPFDDCRLEDDDHQWQPPLHHGSGTVSSDDLPLGWQYLYTRQLVAAAKRVQAEPAVNVVRARRQLLLL